MIRHGAWTGARGKRKLIFVEDDSSIVQLHDAVSHIVVAVVMTDNDYGFSLGSQRRQDVVIKNALEVRILVSRPLVKNIDGPIFKIGCQQRQPFALAV